MPPYGSPKAVALPARVAEATRDTADEICYMYGALTQGEGRQVADEAAEASPCPCPKGGPAG